MRNNSYGGASLREAVRRGARESVAFARRRRGELGWLHLGVYNLVDAIYVEGELVTVEDIPVFRNDSRGMEDKYLSAQNRIVDCDISISPVKTVALYRILLQVAIGRRVQNGQT